MAFATMAPLVLAKAGTSPLGPLAAQRDATEICRALPSRASITDLKSGSKGLVLPGKFSRYSTAKTGLGSRRPRAFRGVQTESAAAVTTKLSWQELHGAKDWAGLLEYPGEGGKKILHPELLKELVKYGELTQATYDGFIADSADKVNGGKNMYTRAQLLDKSLPADSLARAEGYTVAKYMHSTSGLASLYGKDSWIYKMWGDKKERQVWAGYVGYKFVDTEKSEIEIVVAFRGTILLKEWVSNAAGDAQKPWLGFGKAGVHNGFQQIYRDDGDLDDADDKLFKKYEINDKAVAPGSPQDVVHKTILELASKYKVRNIVTVGHSLGAALATICALDLGQFVKDDPKGKKAFGTGSLLGFFKPSSPPPVTGFVFASPRVGNQEFSDLFNQYNVKLFRTTDIPDIVPKVPGVLEYDEKDAEKAGWQNAIKNKVLEWVDNTNVMADWVEVGAEVKVDYRKSKILKTDGKPQVQLGRYHNMEIQLYLLVTQLGTQRELTSPKEPGPGERHYKLCNKSDDTLIPAFAELNTPPVPKSWWGSRPEKGNGIPSSDPEEC